MSYINLFLKCYIIRYLIILVTDNVLIVGNQSQILFLIQKN
jgi:hypothetical protein